MLNFVAGLEDRHPRIDDQFQLRYVVFVEFSRPWARQSLNNWDCTTQVARGLIDKWMSYKTRMYKISRVTNAETRRTYHLGKWSRKRCLPCCRCTPLSYRVVRHWREAVAGPDEVVDETEIIPEYVESQIHAHGIMLGTGIVKLEEFTMELYLRQLI